MNKHIREEKLQELWTVFNDNQTQIEATRVENDEQLKQITREEGNIVSRPPDRSFS